ncbi:DegT/DnrJ/EryC1/StrS family aminotransferase [Flavobacterium sp.]|uniref:DegT/DnrJ/EryC1/StrS family aminotransferase n=1 Tax=Flavobacterium sp. TaxID=239 RepID=UPI003C5E1ACC
MDETKIKLLDFDIQNEVHLFLDSFKNDGPVESSKWITNFETALSEKLHSPQVLALNSGTAAIHLGLILLGVTKGDEVICQSLTFSASANPILYQGATPVFVDSEFQTWNICPIALEEAILDRIKKGKKPKAIIAVHVFGVPYQIEAIQALSKKYEIPVLEDSAEALGSQYKQQYCGTFGDIGVLSFNLNKIITTTAGGALLLNDEIQKEKALFYATQAKDEAVHYQHSELGYNYRISPLLSGIGIEQLKTLEDKLKKKKEIHDFYVNSLKDISYLKVFTVLNPHCKPNYWLTTILVEDTLEKSNEGLRLALKSAGIESRLIWKPLHLQPFFKDYDYYGNKVAEQIFNHGLCLPSTTSITQTNKEKIVKVVYDYFHEF